MGGRVQRSKQEGDEDHAVKCYLAEQVIFLTIPSTFNANPRRVYILKCTLVMIPWLPQIFNIIFHCLSKRGFLHISNKYKYSHLFCASVSWHRRRTLASFRSSARSTNVSAVCIIYRYLSSTETCYTQNCISSDFRKHKITQQGRMERMDAESRVLDHVPTSRPA